jgi:peptidoglycan/LPS O-acetylase OafA/YrhL
VNPWRARVGEAFSVRRNLRGIFVPPPGHLRALDGLRALSILWVIVFHAGWFARFSLPLPGWFALVLTPWMLPIWRGDFGVDVFFVLSGFLIAGMLLDEQGRTGRIALGRFYARRLMRLWPALLAVTLVERLANHANHGMLWANALYLNDMVPVGIVALGWTWSLAIEEQFYLVCPWILRAVARLSLRGRLAIVAVLIAVQLAVATFVVLVARIYSFDAEIIGALDIGRWAYAFDIFYDKPWMRAGPLLAGVAAAMIYRAPTAMEALGRGGAATAAGLVGAVATMALATHWPLVLGANRVVEVAYLASFRTVFGVCGAFLVLVTLSAHPWGQALARPLSSRWLFPFAQLAYAAYLVNPMVALALARPLGRFLAHGEEPMHILVPCDLAATLVCAVALHVLVERPGMDLRPQ